MRHYFSEGCSKVLLLVAAAFVAACSGEAPGGSDPAATDPATTEATDAESVRVKDYCKATMECEGGNTDAIHHICMVAPIPFGMMLCEGKNERSVNACVAAIHTFRETAVAYDCLAPVQKLTDCLIDKSVCTDNTFDQSACKLEMKGLVSCVDAASANHASVPQLSGASSCTALSSACGSCSNPSLELQCRQVAMVGDDGTCTQALTAVQQSCL